MGTTRAGSHLLARPRSKLRPSRRNPTTFSARLRSLAPLPPPPRRGRGGSAARYARGRSATPPPPCAAAGRARSLHPRLPRAGRARRSPLATLAGAALPRPAGSAGARWEPARRGRGYAPQSSRGFPARLARFARRPHAAVLATLAQLARGGKQRARCAFSRCPLRRLATLADARGRAMPA